MAYVGTYETGKLVVYPIRKDLDEQGLGGLNDPIRQAAAIAQLAFSAVQQMSIDGLSPLEVVRFVAL